MGTWNVAKMERYEIAKPSSSINFRMFLSRTWPIIISNEFNREKINMYANNESLTHLQETWNQNLIS